MKRLLFIGLVTICCNAMAQMEGGTIGEVTVKGSRTIQKNDALWIVPTETELQHSTNAYSLLSRLALDGIRIDPSAHTLTATDNRGSVGRKYRNISRTITLEDRDAGILK